MKIKKEELIEFMKEIKSGKEDEVYNELNLESDIKILKDEIEYCNVIIDLINRATSYGD